MLKSVKLTNFFSFKDQTVELHPKVNVLIGVNGSGKSNFLKAIKLLSQSVKKQLVNTIVGDWAGIDNVLFSDKVNNTCSCEIEYDYLLNFAEEKNNYYHYMLKLLKTPTIKNFSLQEKLINEWNENFYSLLDSDDNSLSNKFPYIIEIANSQETHLSQIIFNEHALAEKDILFYTHKLFRSIQVYENFDTRINSFIRNQRSVNTEHILSENGENLAALFNTLKIEHSEYYLKIIDLLQDVNPNYLNLNLKFSSAETTIKLQENNLSDFISSRHISDGTLRYLCLLAILYNPNRGKLVCIDEPETGLHPDMLYNIVSGIREASEDTQFIIATHSDRILDYFDVENIRIFTKNENNETIVTIPNADELREDDTLGKMWRDGVLGGNRW